MRNILINFFIASLTISLIACSSDENAEITKKPNKDAIALFCVRTGGVVESYTIGIYDNETKADVILNSTRGIFLPATKFSISAKKSDFEISLQHPYYRSFVIDRSKLSLNTSRVSLPPPHDYEEGSNYKCDKVSWEFYESQFLVARTSLNEERKNKQNDINKKLGDRKI